LFLVACIRPNGHSSSFDEIYKRSSHFINSCLRSRYNLVRSILLCTALFMLSIIRLLVEILDFVVVVSFSGWKICLSGFVSTNDCFHNFCMNNIPIAQLQIASLVEELLILREGFVALTGYFILEK